MFRKMPQQKASAIWLFLLTTLAIGIRLPQVSESLWLDELHSAWIVAGPWDAVVARAQIGNQSPLYFYLVKASVALFGLDEVGMRFPSLVAGAALVPLVVVVALRWTNSIVAATVAGMMVAVDHHCVFYAQEARPYALVQLAGLVHVLLCWRLQQTPTVRLRFLFIVVTVLLFYLHYTAVLLFAGEVACYALQRICKPGVWKYAPWQLVMDFTVAALACGPTVPHLLDIAGRRENWSAIVSMPSLARLVFMFSLQWYLLLPLGGVVVLTLVDRWGGGRLFAVVRKGPATTPHAMAPDRQCRSEQRPIRAGSPPVLLLVCWFAVPVGLAWIGTVTGVAHLFMVRYLVVTVVSPILLCAILLAACPRGRPRLVLAAVVMIAAIQSTGMIAQWRADGRLVGDRNQGWRAAVAFLSGRPDGSQWPLFLRSGLLEADDLGANDDLLLREYCLLPIGGMYPLDAAQWNRVPLPNTAAGKLAASHLQMIRSAGGAWLLINGTERSRRQIQAEAIAAISAAGMNGRVTVRRTYGEVEVLGLAVE